MKTLLAVLLLAMTVPALAAPLSLDNGLSAPLAADDEKDKEKEKKE